MTTADPIKTNAKTEDKMSWDPEDVEWQKPQTTAQQIADKIKPAETKKK